MSILFLGAVIFILTLLVTELTAWTIRSIRYPDRAEIRKRLLRSAPEPTGEEGTDISKKKVFSDVPFLNRILSAAPGTDGLELMMRRANVNYTMGFFLLLSATLGLTGHLIFYMLSRNLIISIGLALVAAAMPLITLRSKKNKRMAKFEKQLPEALGLIARALRAGHAFTSGMKLTSEEIGDPLGPEFEETLDEINFGVSVPDALKSLARRVDCPDLSFFVVAVILQRETGGNLAEIIENLAQLMRDRFRFRGKVKILTAEGRLTGKILVAIPLVLFGFIYLTNPTYAGQLFIDPLGRMMAGVGLFLIVLGHLVITWILKIDV